MCVCVCVCVCAHMCVRVCVCVCVCCACMYAFACMWMGPGNVRATSLNKWFGIVLLGQAVLLEQYCKPGG